MINQAHKVYLKKTDELLRALLADESKNRAMLDSMEYTIRQMKAKSSFRLALINQLLENEQIEKV